MKFLQLSLFLVLLQGCANPTVEESQFACTGLDDCTKIISLRVQRNAKWICDQKSIDKTVAVLTWIDRTGAISEIKLNESSGDSEFDQAALLAIETSAPFNELSLLSESDFKMASKIKFVFAGSAPLEK